jgi:hypothetical protein
MTRRKPKPVWNPPPLRDTLGGILLLVLLAASVVVPLLLLATVLGLL